MVRWSAVAAARGCAPPRARAKGRTSRHDRTRTRPACRRATTLDGYRSRGRRPTDAELADMGAIQMSRWLSSTRKYASTGRPGERRQLAIASWRVSSRGGPLARRRRALPHSSRFPLVGKEHHAAAVGASAGVLARHRADPAAPAGDAVDDHEVLVLRGGRISEHRTVRTRSVALGAGAERHARRRSALGRHAPDRQGPLARRGEEQYRHPPTTPAPSRFGSSSICAGVRPGLDDPEVLEIA